MSLKEYDVCDNVFLGEVVSEVESFYEVKFGRKPKLVKKVSGKTSTLAKAESLFGGRSNALRDAGGREEKKTEYISGYAKARERREKIGMGFLSGPSPSSCP